MRNKELDKFFQSDEFLEIKEETKALQERYGRERPIDEENPHQYTKQELVEQIRYVKHLKDFYIAQKTLLGNMVIQYNRRYKK